MSIMSIHRRSLWIATLVLAAGAACKSSTAGDADALIASAGDNQTVSVGKAANTPLRVLVQDGSGSPAAGVTVSWSIVLGNGSLSAASQTTDQNGFATATYTAGATATTTTVEAKAGSGEVFFKLFVVPA